jgi:lipopolysaccharide export LptBFGC system permease protein LptF
MSEPPASRPQQQAVSSRDDASLGELLGQVTQDLQNLFRQELALAKAELRTEALKSGKAAGMLGGAGFAAYMALLLGSFTVVYALANVMDAGWSALLVTVVWAIVAAVLYVLGRARMREVAPKPERTIETLKEDAQWARHPTK